MVYFELIYRDVYNLPCNMNWSLLNKILIWVSVILKYWNLKK